MDTKQLVFNAAGSASAPQITFSADNSGISLGTDQVVVTSAGSNTLTIFSDRLEIKASSTVPSTPAAGYAKIFIDNAMICKVLTSAGTTSLLAKQRGKVPLYSFSGFSYTELKKYVSGISFENNASIAAHTHGATVSDFGYFGAGYFPTLERLYMAPYTQAAQANWHYINGSTGVVTAYAHGSAAVSAAYTGGVYSPTLDRLYFTPHAQANQANWHYVTNTGTITAYAHGATAVANAYRGGVHSPTQDRIYFVPTGQSDQANWHYINSAGTVVAYAHGATAVINAYSGGAYSPTQNRIYFAPFGQASQANWHYIDCGTGTVTAYAHGSSAVASAYSTAVYSPLQNRIYFVPLEQYNQTNWHYINCDTGAVVAYTHTAITTKCYGGAYMPTQNAIYFAPHSNMGGTYFVNGISCDTGDVDISFTIASSGDTFTYVGANYLPNMDRVYFIPHGQANQTSWDYIRDVDRYPNVSKSLMGGALFNKL